MKKWTLARTLNFLPIAIFIIFLFLANSGSDARKWIGKSLSADVLKCNPSIINRVGLTCTNSSDLSLLVAIMYMVFVATIIIAWWKGGRRMMWWVTTIWTIEIVVFLASGLDYKYIHPFFFGEILIVLGTWIIFSFLRSPQDSLIEELQSTAEREKESASKSYTDYIRIREEDAERQKRFRNRIELEKKSIVQKHNEIGECQKELEDVTKDRNGIQNEFYEHLKADDSADEKVKELRRSVETISDTNASLIELEPVKSIIVSPSRKLDIIKRLLVNLELSNSALSELEVVIANDPKLMWKYIGGLEEINRTGTCVSSERWEGGPSGKTFRCHPGGNTGLTIWFEKQSFNKVLIHRLGVHNY